ncbi:MAG: helix-hairpin-helix domain-containing protein [Mycoplasmatales bacterium]
MSKILVKLRKYKIIILFVSFILIKVILNLVNINPTNIISSDTKDLNKQEITAAKEKQEKTNNKVFVDVKGAVVNPGLYEVDASFRVGQVIDEAGGFSHANTQCVNLSQKITDEQLIFIPDESQMCETPKSNSQNNLENSQKNQNLESSSQININTATAEELTTLTGIGESRAADIIAYREENGNFTTKEEIKNVSGIGESTYKNIEDNITV